MLLIPSVNPPLPVWVYELRAVLGTYRQVYGRRQVRFVRGALLERRTPTPTGHLPDQAAPADHDERHWRAGQYGDRRQCAHQQADQTAAATDLAGLSVLRVLRQAWNTERTSVTEVEQ